MGACLRHLETIWHPSQRTSAHAECKATGLVESQGSAQDVFRATHTGSSRPESCLQHGRAAAAGWFPIPAPGVCQTGLCRFCIHVFPDYFIPADMKFCAVCKEHSNWECASGDAGLGTCVGEDALGPLHLMVSLVSLTCFGPF